MPRKPIQDPEKRCVTCGKRLSRNRFNGRLEDRTAFLKRQFCSLSCANARSKGGLSRKAFHSRARKFKKSECEACGDKRYLHVHHIDEDWMNNDPENLQTLCVFCHHFWHAAHIRRGAKCRSRMPDLRSLLL